MSSAPQPSLENQVAVVPAVAPATGGPAPVGEGRPPIVIPAPGGGGIDVLRSFNRHRMVALVVAIFVVLAGTPVAWMKGKPQYGVTAVIYISPRFLANLQDSVEHELQSDQQYRQYVQQNAKTINRYDILVEALRKAGQNNSFFLTPKETVEHAAERLQGALQISPVPDTYQIAVSLQGGKAEGLAELVNGVLTTFISKAKAEEFYASDERIRNLIRDRTRLEQEIAEKQQRRLDIGQELGVSSFSNNFVNPYDHLLASAREALAGARVQNIQTEAALAAYDGKQRAGGADSLRSIAEQEASRDLALTSLVSSQGSRRTQLLSLMNGLSPDHPGRRAAERELAEMDRQLDELHQKLVDAAAKSITDQRKAEAYKTLRIVEKLNAELEQQASRTAWFTKNYQEGIQLGNSIDQAQKRIDGIQDRIDSLSLEKSAPGFVRMFSAARKPTTPEKGGRKNLIAGVLVLGLVLGLLVPVAADMFDPRLHSPRDVEKLLGFAPVGWLLEKSEAGPDFAREQSLRLASRMVQDQQAHNSRIFAMTSVKARGGTSTLVIDTAAALRSLGVSALAVEANAYRADPRYRSPDDRGLTVVLQGTQEFADAVVPGDASMPDHVAVGDVEDQKNLPDIQRLIEILRAASDAYSIVLVDLPPILASVDAEFIARGVDVTIMVIEAGVVTKMEVQRAAACLERIRVPAVSAILNRVRLDAADGFARAARHEFQTGTGPDTTGWVGRKLWT